MGEIKRLLEFQGRNVISSLIDLTRPGLKKASDNPTLSRRWTWPFVPHFPVSLRFATLRPSRLTNEMILKRIISKGIDDLLSLPTVQSYTFVGMFLLC